MAEQPDVVPRHQRPVTRQVAPERAAVPRVAQHRRYRRAFAVSDGQQAAQLGLIHERPVLAFLGSLEVADKALARAEARHEQARPLRIGAVENLAADAVRRALAGDCRIADQDGKQVGRLRRTLIERPAVAGPAWADMDLVFSSALGTPIEPGTIRRTWARVMRRAGVGHVRWHDLRHAHATLMLSAGVHPKVVSERLGHASVGITLDTYSHVLPGIQAAAAAQLDTLLSEPLEQAQ